MSTVDAAVGAMKRTQLIDDACKLLGADADLHSKSDAEIMRMAIRATDPNLRFDGLDETYIRARFDAAVRYAGSAPAKKTTTSDTAREDSVAGFRAAAKVAEGQQSGKPRLDSRDARARMVEHNRSLATKPLGARFDASRGPGRMASVGVRFDDRKPRLDSRDARARMVEHNRSLATKPLRLDMSSLRGGDDDDE